MFIYLYILIGSRCRQPALKVPHPQNSLQNAFVWLVGFKKRLALHRVPAQHLTVSMKPDESGMHSGRLQSVLRSEYLPSIRCQR